MVPSELGPYAANGKIAYIEIYTSSIKETNSWLKWTIHWATIPIRPRRARLLLDLRKKQRLGPVTSGIPAGQKLLNAVRSMMPGGIRGGEVWAVTTARNEEDILPFVINAFLLQGVDRIVVADNGSTDGTRKKLSAFERTGHVIVVDDFHPAHLQKEKMTRLARAAAVCGASWVIPFDADEVWLTESGEPIAQFLRECDADVVEADSYEYYPVKVEEHPDPLVRFQMRSPTPETWGKIAFRSNVLAYVNNGNHSLEHPGERTKGLRLAHFRYRSAEQMYEKVTHGARALALTSYGPGTGRHWRELGQLDRQELAMKFLQLTRHENLLKDPVVERLKRACKSEIYPVRELPSEQET